MNKQRLIPLIIILYILSNIILTIFDITICETTGCELSKEIINIPYLYLNGLGLLYAIILFILGYKNSKYFKDFALLGIVAETILLSMLYYMSSTTCIFCFGFYFLLILNYIMNKETEKRFLILPVIIFLSLFIFKYDNLNISKLELKDNNTYLIQSESCKHCKEVKEYFKKDNIQYTKLSVNESMGLLSSLNINQIPVLLIKEPKQLLILDNKNKILNYYNTLNTPKSNASNIFGQNISQQNVFDFTQQDEGCAIEKLTEEECE